MFCHKCQQQTERDEGKNLLRLIVDFLQQQLRYFQTNHSFILMCLLIIFSLNTVSLVAAYTGFFFIADAPHYRSLRINRLKCVVI